MDRSILYNLEPMGIGTPFVESLTSYITRIADAHCVQTGSLISKVYAPCLNKEYLSKISMRGGNGFFDSAIGINGLGKLANEFSELTDKFTGRSDLSCTTLKNWSSIFPNRGLLKKTKSWCPKCYEELKLSDEVIYDPLIWNFQIVNYCLKHKSPLLNICESCNRSVPVINRTSIPGFCSKCGNWLGSTSLTSEEEIKEGENEYLSDILLIEELLAQTDLDLSSIKMSELIAFYVNEVFDKSPSKAAKYLKIPRSTFILWVSGYGLPSIHYLIQICKILGISIIGFLHRKEPVKTLGSTDSFVKSRKRYDHDEIKNTLDNLIKNKEPVSISGVAKMIGCDRKLLSKLYKSECNQIKENYNAYLQAKKEERVNIKTKQLNEAFDSLVNHGIYPSRRRLEELLGTGFLKEKAMQEYWNELKRS